MDLTLLFKKSIGPHIALQKKLDLIQLFKKSFGPDIALQKNVGPDIALQLLQPPKLEVLIHLLVHVLNRIQMTMMIKYKKEDDEADVKYVQIGYH